MLFKLSSRNVRRSMKDYSIYFLTLVIGVCIFYIFNSLESQTAMIELTQSKRAQAKLLTEIMSYVSIFVSFILGFLIMYANNFIIKRRSKEFGIYMTLGISRNKISYMLFFETLIIGIVSLVVGLFIGVLLSQGLASVTAKMFESDMSKYKFIFSKDACLKTALYFSIMFIVVILLNFAIVSRYKLINLINNEKRNEKLKGSNLTISAVLFVLSIICLFTAYKSTLGEQLIYSDGGINCTYIALGILGTLLFFRALAGFLIIVIQNSKNYYLRNLNTFTLRQLNSKINTHYVSMSVICIMLFIAVGMTSAGLGTKKSLKESIQFKTPFDVCFEARKGINGNLSELLKQNGFDLNQYSKELVDYNLYIGDITFGEMFKNSLGEISKQQFDFIKDKNVEVLKLSDYNKLNKIKGKDAIVLKDNEVLLLSDVGRMKEAIKEYLSQYKTLNLNNKEFNLKKYSEYEAIYTSPQSMNMLTLIVNDKHTEGLKVSKNYLSLNLTGDEAAVEEKILEKIYDLQSASEAIQGLDMYTYGKIDSYDSSIGTANMFLYIGIYVGMVFLIAGAAVLALSQLSGANESLSRYKILRKLGVSSNMINKSIFIQVLMYFCLPIILALVHSIFGIKVANDFVKIFGDINPVKNNILTIGSILVIYGVYFVITYNSYKRIVNSQS